jgi:hypothetical protein
MKKRGAEAIVRVCIRRRAAQSIKKKEERRQERRSERETEDFRIFD